MSFWGNEKILITHTTAKRCIYGVRNTTIFQQAIPKGLAKSFANSEPPNYL